MSKDEDPKGPKTIEPRLPQPGWRPGFDQRFPSPPRTSHWPSRWLVVWPGGKSPFRSLRSVSQAYTVRPKTDTPAERQAQLSGEGRVAGRVRGAVQALDWALRERQGIFEYSRDPRCMLRISVGDIRREVPLLGARPVPVGARIVDIHFWNEHMAFWNNGRAQIAHATRSLRFGATLRSRFELSMIELAAFLADHGEFDDVAAIRAKFAYPIHAHTDVIREVMHRFGFEAEPDEIPPRLISFYILNDLFLWVLAWGFNARGVSGLGSVRRRRRAFWMSRKTLDSRYGSRYRAPPVKAAGD